MLHIPVRQHPVTLRGQLYQILHQAERPYTRQALARQCGISMPTLYQNLSELMDEGLVCDSGTDRSTGGRKAQRLAIVPEARFAVGISVTDDRLRLAAMDLKLEEIAYQELPLAVCSQPDPVGATAAALEEFLDEGRLDRGRLLGVGITIPGILTPECDRVVYAPSLGLKDAPLTGLDRVSYPVYVVNDATCSGYAEWYVRHGQQDMAYLSLETGVGGTILLSGIPYDGDHRRSGEFGHICVEPGGRQCSCGQRGCLEAYCSARRIREDSGLELDEFFRQMERHDPACEAIGYDVLRHLAIGVSNIHTALDCSVVLGGWVSEYLPPYLSVLRRYALEANPFAEDAEFVQLSTLRRHIAPVGAALNFVLEFVEHV